MVNVIQDQVHGIIADSRSQFKARYGTLLESVPKTLDGLITSILPNQLIIPISQVDTILESIPILKNTSGQSYRPSAESYRLRVDSQPLVGQAAYAAHCGLVFKTLEL